MFVNKLPDDIIWMILQKATSSTWHNTSQWYRELRMLSVCRQWRYLALPFHYRRLFLVFDNAPISCPYCMHNNHKSPIGRHNKVKTNLELYKSLDAIKYAKECVIVLGSGLHMSDLKEDIRILFENTWDMWRGIEKLEFSLSRRFRHETYIDLNEVPTSLADQLATVFCGVRSFSSSCSKNNIAGIAMVNSVVDMYLDRLCRLSLDVPTLCKSLSFSPKLTHLALDFDYYDIMQLPRIYSSSLLYLRINNAPADLDWINAFGGESKDDGELVFDNLRGLSVSHSNDMWMTVNTTYRRQNTHAMHRPLCKLVFPRLEWLTIHMCPSNGGILQFSEFPQTGIKRLELGTTLCSDFALVGGKFSLAVDNLVISAAIIQMPETRDPVYVYNSILDKVSTGRYGATIVMPFGSTIAEPLQARWPSLVKLELFEPTATSVLLSMVPRLPSLKKLTVHYLVLDVICKVSRIGKDYLQHVLSHSIMELSLDTYDTSQDERFPWTVFYFVVLAPKLRLVAIPDATRPALRTFINKHEAEYSHLSSIVF